MLNRRAFLTSSLALLSTPRLIARIRQSPRFDRNPFTLGVASGDPSPDGVVLWTRLAPNPLAGGGMTPEGVTVEWAVADDDRMTKIVRRGTAIADPEFAHSVHVEVAGLRPDRWYWYQFRVGDAETPPARTRTLPEPDAAIDHLRFAFVSCQHLEQGLFTAYRHVADEPIDLVFHLGDYIYEGPNRNTGLTRSHLGPEPTTLEQYRTRYAQYKMDADLQASHAACPWIATWDDHEVSDNYAGAISRRNDPIDQFLLRRAAAYRAYYEHLPLRRVSLPHGPDARMYRRFAYGSLASFFVLDTRQYRTDQPCGDGVKAACDGVFDPAATMMGPEQEKWFVDGMTRSRARWNVIPQQVMMAPVDQAPGPERRLAMDQWAGYDAPLTRMMKFFAKHTARNPVVLSGDIHSNWVNDLKADFLDPESPIVATELVGTSISSGGDGSDLPEVMKGVLSENPFVRFHNDQRGYVVCDVARRVMRADYRVMEYVTRSGSPVSTRASFVIEDGRPGASRV
jgi:alkaline phosphatase D